MPLRSLFIIFFVLSIQRAASQELKYLIRFRDKKNNGFSLSDPSAFLSDKSIHRRFLHNIPIDSTDLPITAAYLDSLSDITSVHILNSSRWFNQALISVQDASVIPQLLAFPFVISSEPVNNGLVKKVQAQATINRQTGFSSMNSSENIQNKSSLFSLDYGASANQIQIHHGDFLHNAGFHGETMTIAILDDGFNNYVSNPAFDSLRINHRILGSYDFVHQKVSVNEEEVHGANCFSILAANLPGIFVGSAPAANYWLFKTEDDLSESPVEEQNWVAAAEFADSVGADLISTSLGYAYFDDSLYDLNYAERNGHGSLVTRGANLAVAKGIVVTAAAGNSGLEPTEKKYVSCPADGDSVFAVGAVDKNGLIGNFSSLGPNGSGQVKPDGVSVGVAAFLISNDGNLYSGNGTSYANPNLAGLITCLWQAFPEMNVKDILSAVRQSSSRFSNPDGLYGYGIPDFEKAYQILNEKRLNILQPLTPGDWIRVFPVPFYHTFHIYFQPAINGIASFQLLSVSGELIQTETVAVVAGQEQVLEIIVNHSLATGVYFIRYNDSQRSKTLKVMAY
jgi:serine protease AprX